MGNGLYVKTRGLRNKINKRVIRPFEFVPGSEVTSDGRYYVVGKDGVRRRVGGEKREGAVR